MRHASRFATLPRWSRRDFLRAAGVAAAGLTLPRGLIGCGDGGSGAASSEMAIPLTVDPSVGWWLQNGFDPVFDELSSTDLRVTRGNIPRQLSGLYVRNGSNPQQADSPHWFFGDGMVHGVRFEQGRAAWYGNKYVRTPLYEQGISFGQPNTPPPIGGNNQSNVSCIYHAGKLLSSGEVGFPYELDPRDLSTLGVHDFAGMLPTSFTAHPKIDPATGYLHFFGYWFGPPFLTYLVADANGHVIHRQEIPVAASSMIHSFAITEQDVVFWELPVLFDIQAAIRGEIPFFWKPDYGARIGIMPLGGDAAAIRWVEIEPCYVFHEVNAHRDGDDVVIDVCRHDHMFDNGSDLEDSRITLRRWRVNTAGAALSFRDEIVLDRELELPSRDRRVVGLPNRYGWFVTSRKHPDTLDLGGIASLDYRSGRLREWDPGPNRHANEALFVPGDSGEGEGWLLTLVYNRADDASDLCILDPLRVDKGPIAEIRLPRRVPHGFHAAWVPA
ncbi:MAG: carotenoid oxygenase family protein [bacterium]